MLTPFWGLGFRVSGRSSLPGVGVVITQRSYSLNSLKGGCSGDYIGE